jgi:hypothetical protein
VDRQHRVLVCALQLLTRVLSSLHRSSRTGAGHVSRLFGLIQWILADRSGDQFPQCSSGIITGDPKRESGLPHSERGRGMSVDYINAGHGRSQSSSRRSGTSYHDFVKG